MKEIIIAGRDVRIYIAECLYALKSNDQIVLKCLERYDSQAEKIYYALSRVGIKLNKEYRGALVEIKKETEDNCKPAKERIIADKDIRVYITECVYAFGGGNQIIISGLDKYADRIIHVYEVLNGVGIELDKEHRTINGKPKFESIPTQIENKESGRIENKMVLRLGLTKIPEVIKEEYPKYKPKFKSSMIQIENREHNRIETKIIHELELTKIPGLYMYTEPDKEVEYPKVEPEIEMFE